MTNFSTFAKRTFWAGFLLATLGLAGCHVYPAGKCMSCQCGNCDHGLEPAGRGNCPGCGGECLESEWGPYPPESAAAPMPAPHARFHPVPTRPVFAKRGLSEWPGKPIEYVEPETPGTASVVRKPRDTRSGEPMPTIARRPGDEEPDLAPVVYYIGDEAADGPAEPALLEPVQARRPSTKAGSPSPQEPVVDEANGTEVTGDGPASGDVWRARLMRR